MTPNHIIWRLFLLPGIVLHELAHYYFCRTAGVQILETCFFSFGSPAGFVVHKAPERFRSHCAIALGPLLINSIASVALFGSAITTWRELILLDVADWDMLALKLLIASWLGLVAGLQALPSSGDAISLWQVAKWQIKRGNPLAFVAYPVALLLQFTDWLRSVWVDWAYALAMLWCAYRLVFMR